MAKQSTSTGSRKNKALKEDDFARKNIAPNDGISKSSFFEAINTRGFCGFDANSLKDRLMKGGQYMAEDALKNFVDHLEERLSRIEEKTRFGHDR